MCDKRRKGCAKHPESKRSYHPTIQKNISDGGKNQKSKRNFGFSDRREHGGENIVHKKKRKADKIDSEIQHRVL